MNSPQPTEAPSEPPQLVVKIRRDYNTWVANETLEDYALRFTPHPTHAHVDMALEWIERVKPRRAILTNMHIDLDFDDLAGKLPAGVEPAFDGLRFEHQLNGNF